ncbi:MAG: CDP-alcohol phosphatidyltransferase family protein [Actinobacteria bacterium]|nr:CDP-alcohol phosphatidyltransferase family protein [Actinomycetota bacterium]
MATRAISPYAQLPNALTVFRLVLIPVFVVVLLGADEGRSVPAFVVFAVAGTTDQVDGWLARRWRVESAFGKVADPLADRLLIDSAVVLLFLADRLPWVALAAILARDVVLVAGYKLVVPRGYDLSVSGLGKLATWVLYASLGFMLLTGAGTSWPLWLFWAGLVLAVAAAALYVRAALRGVRT